MAKRKLLLFLDVNQTILVIDHAAGKSLSDGINCALARAAWVRHVDEANFQPSSRALPALADFTWHDGSPLVAESAETVPALVRYGGPDQAVTVEPYTFLDAPPSGCHCYYDVFGKAVSRSFTLQGPGSVYKPLADKLIELLKWPANVPHSEHLVTEHAGENYHIVVPSLFNLLTLLKSQQRDFRVILSTMGHNISAPAEVFECFARHAHPHFSKQSEGLDLESLRCRETVHWTLDIGAKDSPSPYVLRSERGDEPSLESEDGIYDFLAGSPQACGVRSSFQRWEGEHFLAAAGKRMWLTAEDNVHPLLFDDNIKRTEDSVVAVRARRRRGDRFVTLTCEETQPLHDAMLLQADIIQAILNPDYFIDSVAKCEANFDKLMQDQDGIQGLIGSKRFQPQ